MLLRVLFLLMALWGVLSNMDLQKLSAVPGDSVSFPIRVSENTEIFSVFWSHSRGREKQMVAIAKLESCLVKNNRYLNRVKCQEPELSLKLNNVTNEDSGIYEAVIYTSGDAIHMYFQLQVTANSQSAQCTWTNILLVTGLGILITNVISKT